MGIAVASEAQYQDALRRLFPQGEYWDSQFNDPQSDVSLFVKAKTPELVRFRERMSVLQSESVIETTDELVTDWERVLLGEISVGLDLEERRLLMLSKIDVRLNRAELQKIAAIFDMTIMSVEIPYTPRFFGFAKFAVERNGSFTSFSVLKITVTKDGIESTLWADIKAELERHRFARLRFGQDRLGYFPFYKMREIVYRGLYRGCFGYARFAHNQIVPSPDSLPGYVDEVLAIANFYRRFERALLDEHIARTKPYQGFEEAIREKLLANHIPIFFYEGEQL